VRIADTRKQLAASGEPMTWYKNKQIGNAHSTTIKAVRQ